MGVAVWLLYMIALWGVLGIPRQYKGVSYEIQERRLREVDIRRVLAGQSVSDGLGNAIIDPLEDQIEIVVVDSSGESHVGFAAMPTARAVRSIVILWPSPDASYGAVVAACDAARERVPDAVLWLEEPQR